MCFISVYHSTSLIALTRSGRYIFFKSNANIYFSFFRQTLIKVIRRKRSTKTEIRSRLMMWMKRRRKRRRARRDWRKRGRKSWMNWRHFWAGELVSQQSLRAMSHYDSLYCCWSSVVCVSYCLCCWQVVLLFVLLTSDVCFWSWQCGVCFWSWQCVVMCVFDHDNVLCVHVYCCTWQVVVSVRLLQILLTINSP